MSGLAAVILSIWGAIFVAATAYVPKYTYKSNERTLIAIKQLENDKVL
jgi:hypothetical protein